MRIISKGQQCIFFFELYYLGMFQYCSIFRAISGFILYYLYFMGLQAMGANVKMAETMGATSKVMADMNKMMNPQQVKVKVVESGNDKKFETEFLA